MLAGALGAGCSSQTSEATSSDNGQAVTGGSPCSGVVLDAIRSYKPKSRTDASVSFPVGTLTFAIPAEIPVTTGAPGTGKVKFTFSNGGGLPTQCVYRGQNGPTYVFKKCKLGTPPSPDPDDNDDTLDDDGLADPAPVVGTVVTADTFLLHVSRGLKDAGTTTAELHLGGPVVDDNNACTTDACSAQDGVTHVPINIDDGNHCTIDACDPITGVSHTEVTTYDPPPQAPIQNLQPFPNPQGTHATYSSTNAALDVTNPFFKSLGTNGRACVSCHDPGNSWSLDAATVQARFETSCGLDPIFRPVDGANNPTADVSTMDARRVAYSNLLNKGIIRIEVPVKAPDPNVTAAQYHLIAVDDPTGNTPSCGGSLPACPPITTLSVFRKPLPTTNLKFVPRIMWDGREPDLATQATNATLIHAQSGAAPSTDDVNAIVGFETTLFTSQFTSSVAGSTSAAGAAADPFSLFNTPFALNSNPPTNIQVVSPFPNVYTITTSLPYTLFDAWAADPDPNREQIAHGQTVFNTALLTFVNTVIPPNPQLPNGATILAKVTCGFCHSAVNAGSFTFPQGLTQVFAPGTPPAGVGLRGGFPDDKIAAAINRTPDLPLYTFQSTAAPFPTVQVTDPGMAAFTGLFADLGRFKPPVLRGLAGRAPYFHDGHSATLRDVVEHYNTTFNMNLSDSDKADLTAYLQTL